MGDHLVLSVDPVVVAPAPASVQPPTGSLNSQTADLPASAIPVNGVGKCDIMEAEEKEEEEGKGEGDNLIQKAECRICQLEDSLQNLLCFQWKLEGVFIECFSFFLSKFLLG